MNGRGGEDGVRALVAAADAAFAAGDAERYTDLFAEDGRLYMLHRDPAIGRAAIRDRWAAGFARFDTSAWEPRLEMVEVAGDLGCAFAAYTERLRERATGERTLVRGRLAYFLRRVDGVWRITLLMNSHSHPMEPIR